MLKQSKTQVALVSALGLMIVSQIGFVVYKNSMPETLTIVSPQKVVEKKTNRAGSAKAFGLTSHHEQHFQVASVKELDRVFNSWDYNLAKAKKGGEIPRLYLAKLPKDMKNKKSAGNSTFIQVLLPHILKVNEQILADRSRLLEMQKRQKTGHHLRHPEKMWLSKLASEYRCKSTKIEALLTHVDIVPPSLALAQGILETGGGRSFAALNKNSPFGYMATKTKVAAFESLLHSVKAYILNLNRHKAYASFRQDRALQRKRNEHPCGHKLAHHLTKYSIRGAAYTKDVQNLIVRHGLKGFDQHVRLKP